MRRVGGEAPGLGEGGLEPGQHGIERIGEVVDLVVGAAAREAATQILGGDLPGGARHLAHGLQGAARDDGAPRGREADGHRHEGEQRGQVAGQRRARARERSRDLDDLDGPPGPLHGHGQDPQGSVRRIFQRLDGLPAVRGVQARLEGQGQAARVR